jgi:hypothetical protein
VPSRRTQREAHVKSPPRIKVAGRRRRVVGGEGIEGIEEVTSGRAEGVEEVTSGRSVEESDAAHSNVDDKVCAWVLINLGEEHAH